MRDRSTQNTTFSSELGFYRAAVCEVFPSSRKIRKPQDQTNTIWFVENDFMCRSEICAHSNLEPNICKDKWNMHKGISHEPSSMKNRQDKFQCVRYMEPKNRLRSYAFSSLNKLSDWLPSASPKVEIWRFSQLLLPILLFVKCSMFRIDWRKYNLIPHNFERIRCSMGYSPKIMEMKLF